MRYHKLTGRMGYRENWRGRIVLQVEIERCVVPFDAASTFTGTWVTSQTEWMDATQNDMNELALAGMWPFRPR